MMMLHFLNDVANDAESAKNENYVIIASLQSKTIGKLINRIPASRLLPAAVLQIHDKLSQATSSKMIAKLEGTLRTT